MGGDASGQLSWLSGSLAVLDGRLSAGSRWEHFHSGLKKLCHPCVLRPAESPPGLGSPTAHT